MEKAVIPFSLEVESGMIHGPEASLSLALRRIYSLLTEWLVEKDDAGSCCFKDRG